MNSTGLRCSSAYAASFGVLHIRIAVGLRKQLMASLLNRKARSTKSLNWMLWRKEPAMSEFKVGDKVVFQNSKSDDTEIYTVEAVLDGGRFLGINDYRQAFSSIKFRHAEPQEKAAGHRIESSNDQAISDCSVSNLCQNDTQNSLPIKQENQDMGDDFPIENHISQNCKVEDV